MAAAMTLKITINRSQATLLTIGAMIGGLCISTPEEVQAGLRKRSVAVRKTPGTMLTISKRTRGGVRKKQRSTRVKQIIGIGRNGKRQGSPIDEARKIIQVALANRSVMHTTPNELTRYELQRQLSELPLEQYKKVWESLPEQLQQQLTFPVDQFPPGDDYLHQSEIARNR